MEKEPNRTWRNNGYNSWSTEPSRTKRLPAAERIGELRGRWSAGKKRSELCGVLPWAAGGLPEVPDWIPTWGRKGWTFLFLLFSRQDSGVHECLETTSLESVHNLQSMTTVMLHDSGLLLVASEQFYYARLLRKHFENSLLVWIYMYVCDMNVYILVRSDV